MYKKEVTLQNHEGLLKFNKETGELTEIKHNNGNPSVQVFKPDAKFIKSFPLAWQLLYHMLSPLELKVALKMSTMTKMITNSLEPLDDDYTYDQLTKEFEISRGKVKSIFDRLFTLGVYGKFEVSDSNFKHTKYWVFNPYLSHNGKVVDNLTENLFSNTIFAKCK